MVVDRIKGAAGAAQRCRRAAPRSTARPPLRSGPPWPVGRVGTASATWQNAPFTYLAASGSDRAVLGTTSAVPGCLSRDLATNRPASCRSTGCGPGPSGEQAKSLGTLRGGPKPPRAGQGASATSAGLVVEVPGAGDVEARAGLARGGFGPFTLPGTDNDVGQWIANDADPSPDPGALTRRNPCRPRGHLPHAGWQGTNPVAEQNPR